MLTKKSGGAIAGSFDSFPLICFFGVFFFRLYHSKSRFLTTICENIFGTFSKDQRSNMHNYPA